MVKWKISSGLIVLVAVVITVISALPHKSSFDSDNEELDEIKSFSDDGRLPKDVVPVHYNLRLTTNVHNNGDRAFVGFVKISVKVLADTNLIKLHNRGLIITYMRLTSMNGAFVYDADFSHDTSNQSLIITLVNSDIFLLAGNEYNIEIAFSGNLRTDMGGFYRSLYYVKGETLPRYLAATQFQSTSARSAFPNFDEPALKATFSLAITHASHYEAISNMNGVRSKNLDGTTTTSFDETPIMSSYLLAFVVSDFAYRSMYNGPDKTEHRVYAREEDVENVKMSLVNSDIFLRKLEEYCNYVYEIPKMYSAAIPDFAAGAMENWGLILYKEQYLIVNEESHPREIFNMWTVTAHELAHQFFGNLVTYDWWDKIWLNEGFASFFEYVLVELAYPDEGFRGHFNTRATQNAFRRDSLHSTQPMTTELPKPTEINYDKGGAVIRMFQYTMGDELFQSALHKYLTDNNHKPVATEDLLKVFEEIADDIQGLNISTAFRTWELQKGYPMITASFNSVANQFEVLQEHYLSISEQKLLDDDSSWYIPLSYTTGANPNFESTIFTDYFVDGTSQKNISTAGISGFDGSQWFIFNIQQLGFYRVNYDESNWRKIISILNSDNYEQIHVLNRAQLVDDALTFAFDEVISYDIAFSVISYLERETNYLPWYPVSIHFDKLNFVLKGTPLHNSFMRFARKLLRKLYVTRGLENVQSDTVLDKFGRELAIDWTCKMGDQNCLNYAHSQLTKENPKPVELALLCNGLKGLMRQAEFVNIYRKFQASSDQNDRLRYIDALLCTSDPQTLSDLLETTIGSGSESFYRSHERSRIYSSLVTRSSVGLEVLLNFILRFYDDILYVNGNVFDSWLTTASRRISDYEDEKLIFQAIDQLEAAGRTFGANLRTNIANNIQLNHDFIFSNRYSDSLLFINNYFKAIDDEEQQLRLQKTSEPQMYRIKLNVPQIQNGGLQFTGDVSIDIIIKQNTDKIMFHSKQQTINELRVFDRFGNEVQVLDYSLQTAGDSLTIYFMDILSAGSKITVNIKYSANLLTSSTGFYRTSYVENGQTRYLAATQFQPSSARYAFPCYDEPGFKTPFELSITHDKSYSAIANTFGIDFDNGDGTVTTEFERTPVMSSYLVAFVVSDFAYITNEESRGTRETLHRVWTKPDSISKANFALDTSVKTLKALEDYCGFDYVLPKVDSAAIPERNSAMENWGMVTYWETAMIYQEDYRNISHTSKYSGVTIIAHELSHQFFGNVVTCKWWDQIWLNEGFATLFERLLVDNIDPSFRAHHFMNAFSIHNRAFINDARETTRPMTWDVNTLTEIDNSFDRIAYEKSGAVLRMFLYTIGENNFKKSLQKYLRTYNNKPVISQNLIDTIVLTLNENNAYKIDIDRAFRTWENQRGYPLLNVKYDPSSRVFRLTQERFFETKKVNSDDQSSWYIPLNFATSLSPTFDTTINYYFENGVQELTIPINNFDLSYWYVFNKQQLGYYRVNYDDANWKSLSLALNSDEYSKIHIMNRVQLIDDSFALAQGGYIDFTLAYDILKYLDREDDFFPWYTCYRYLNTLFTVYGNKNEKLNKFFNKLSDKFYNKYKLTTLGTIPDETVPERYGRDYAINFACNNRNEQCLNDSYAVLSRFADEGVLVPNGLERIYCAGLRGVDKQDLFTKIWNIMSNTADTAFKSTLINALGCSDDPIALKAYLDSSIGDGNNVNYTTTQRLSVFNSVLLGNSGLPVVIEFLKREQNAVVSSYRTPLMSLLTNVANSIKNEEDQKMFLSFLLTRPDLTGDNILSLSRLTSNNLDRQKSAQYMQHMNQIERILNEWDHGISDEGQVWRIPKTISKPYYYRVHLDVRNIHTGDRAYSGDTTMHVDILKKTDRIIFHSKNQVFSSITAMNLGTNSEIEITSYRLTPAYETIIVYFAKELPAGSKISLNFKYSTSLVTITTGFYQTSYSMYGTTRYLGATQFEETGARYAFPCYDEPSFKAIFELSFTHDFSVTVFSNTLGTAVSNNDAIGTFTTSFEPSPIMSSYLNAFVVSDLQYIDNSATKADNETLHRIIVREDSLNKASYALENSVAALKALEEYVGYKYEMAKVDSAGMPGKNNAMENWGMIMYRESYMIYDEDIENTPHTQKFSGARVISHEIAHQFFGNAATCAWWSYLWLNEGFAQYLQYRLTDMFLPEWRMLDFMNVLAMQATAFRVDARATARAMTKDANSITEIANLFDSIAYDKAASVLRMFDYAIGSDLFREALNHYITTNDHKPVESQNLIDAFKATFQKNNYNAFDFERAFRTWETQSGFPLIHVRYDLETLSFRLRQERFFEQKILNNNDQSSWYIPVNYATQNNPNFGSTLATDYFLNGEAEKSIDAVPGEWYVFNNQQRGYYRVNYDESNWVALSNVLSSDDYDRIHVMNRAQLIEDSFILVQAGYLNDYQTAYDILKYLVNEDDFFPWYPANRFISPLYAIYGSKNEALNSFVKKLSEKFYAKYKLPADNTIPKDSMPERYGRDLATNLACNSGNEQCLKDMNLLVRQYANDDIRIPNGLESMYCHGFRGTGKQDEFVKVWRKMQITADTTFKTTLINGLGCTDDKDALTDYLESTLGSGASQVNYTQTERRAVFTAVLKSYSSLPVVVEFLNKFELDIISRYGWTLQTILSNVATTIRTKDDQIIFTDYLLTLQHLSIDVLASLLKTMSNNMNQQTAFTNARQMEIIKTIANEWEFGIIDGHQLRLPETSMPEYYKIHLDVRNIHSGDRAYTGEVRIDIVMLEMTNRIIFHSKNQVINEITAYERTSGREINISGYRLFPSADIIIIYFENALNSGAKIAVNIKYSTSLSIATSAHLFGFFQTSYSMNGTTKYVAATQFQPTHARLAFPCYDEPEFKAVFELSFSHHFSVNVFSNTMEHVHSDTDGSGIFTTHFKPSPIMSSYLNAFIISDFTYISNADTKLPNETLQRVIVREDSKEKAKLALESSVAALKALENYVGFKYEMEKLDSVMVPGWDGAMENWGLITYDPNILLFGAMSTESSHTELFQGVVVISHEIAHQFFGNAVTCHWWSYIWMNEGFARFLQYKLTDIYRPEWRMQDFMNIQTVQGTAFISDARNTTRAMTSSATTPFEIGSLFDSIAYDKSGSVLRMFEYAIGEQLFRQSLNLYVTVNNHKAPVSQALMDAFTETLSRAGYNKLDFDRAFRTWERTKGYPVINVSYESDIQSFRIKQERFFSNKAQRVNDGSSWYIPLTYTTSKNPNFDDTSVTDYFIDGEEMWNILAPQHDSQSWYVFNKQQRGYYRVNYDANNWKLLSNALSSADYNKIHVMNRAQLIDDSFALVSAEYLTDYETAYDILKYLVNEDDFFPWYTANRYINPLYSVFGNKNAVLNNFVKKLSAKFYGKYKLPANQVIPDDIIPERYGRSYAMNLACVSGNEQCLEDTLRLVNNYANFSQPIPKGLESILCHGMRGPNAFETFVALWRRSQLTADASWKTTLLNSLGCTNDETLLFDYLESTLGSGSGNVNYTLSTRQAVFTGSLQSKVIVPVFVKFMTKNSATAVSTFRYSLAQMITMVANTVRTRNDQLLLIDYMATANGLSGDDFKSILFLMTNALTQQQQPQYARQIQLMGVIFPSDPNDEETTISPRITTETEPDTTTTSLTTSSTTTTSPTTSSTTTTSPTTSSTTTTSLTTSSPTTSSTSTSTTTTSSPNNIPTTTQEPTTQAPTTQAPTSTTPNSSISISANLSILVLCAVLTIFSKIKVMNF
ncbi:hypothetical protein ACKWTF_008841 [Chironomus riparius]